MIRRVCLIWSCLFYVILGFTILASSFLKLSWSTHLPLDSRHSIVASPLILVPVAVFELWLGSVLAVGVFSRSIRWISIATFCAFACVALAEVIGGSTNCGCFGGGVHIPPWIMACFDTSVVVLLVQCNPKSLTENTKFHGIQLAAAGVIILTGISTAAVWAFHRPAAIVAQSAPASQAVEAFGSPGSLVVLESDQLIGKPFLLSSHIDVRPRLMKGAWIVLLVHNDCDVCAGAVPRYQAAVAAGKAVKLAIVEIPQGKQAGEPPPWPTSIGLFGKLDTTRDWFATTPLALLVKDGIVRAARDGQDAATPDPAWFAGHQ